MTSISDKLVCKTWKTLDSQKVLGFAAQDGNRSKGLSFLQPFCGYPNHICYHFALCMDISRRYQPETEDRQPEVITWNGRGQSQKLGKERHASKSESWPDTPSYVYREPASISRLPTHRARIRQHVNVLLSSLGLARAARWTC
ncbi:hypothetical protein CGRA01v4_06996 [Colletotrichum graminicola]|nr:hypothetical protein CGRA01v4_06996 [Colletotrichum graminicola]